MDQNRVDETPTAVNPSAENPESPEPARALAESRRPSPHDLDVLSRQLGRPVRDVVEIPARCVCGNPLVAATSPRLSNGTPFPTTFYLTHPVITAAVSDQITGPGVTPNSRGFTPLGRIGNFLYSHISVKQ